MLLNCLNSLQEIFTHPPMVRTNSPRLRQGWIISCKPVFLLDTWFKTITSWVLVNRLRILDLRHSRIQFLPTVIKGLLQLARLIRPEETHNKKMCHWLLHQRKSWLIVVEREKDLIFAGIVNWTISKTITCLEIKKLKNRVLTARNNHLLPHPWFKAITPRDKCFSSKLIITLMLMAVSMTWTLCKTLKEMLIQRANEQRRPIISKWTPKAWFREVPKW